jgi:hypothetical protein
MYPVFARSGFWTAAHEARTDWSMSLGALYLLIAGRDDGRSTHA